MASTPPSPWNEELLSDVFRVVLREPNIRAFWKGRVPLNEGTNGGNIIGVNVIDKEHRMRIAHADHGRHIEIRIIHRPNFHIDAAHIHFLG